VKVPISPIAIAIFQLPAAEPTPNTGFVRERTLRNFPVLGVPQRWPISDAGDYFRLIGRLSVISIGHTRSILPTAAGFTPPGPLPTRPLLSTTQFATWRRPFPAPQNPASFMQAARPWCNSPIRFRYAPLFSAPAHPSRLATNMRPPPGCSSLRFHDSNLKGNGICIQQRTPVATQKPGHRSTRYHKFIISHRD